jgi:hypothetical protein
MATWTRALPRLCVLYAMCEWEVGRCRWGFGGDMHGTHGGPQRRHHQGQGSRAELGVPCSSRAPLRICVFPAARSSFRAVLMCGGFVV